MPHTAELHNVLYIMLCSKVLDF